MTPGDARSLSLLATTSAVGLTTAARVAKRQSGPSVRVFVGGALAAVVMVAFAGEAPDLVGAMAGLLLLTSLLTAGATVAGPFVKFLTGKDVSP